MSTDSSNSSLPTWVAEHQSPWLQSQVQESDSSPDSREPHQSADKAEHSSHEHRPAGPQQQPVICNPSARTNAVAASLVAAPDSSLVAAPDLPGQIPVLLPEKLTASRCLVEVEDGTSTDLAGDAGAVGRFAVATHGQLQQAQLDLKGEMYGLTVVPCASLLCVLNIRQTEAKVDAILSDFVQLRQEAGEDATQDNDALYLFGDDDENYQEPSAAGAATTQGESASKKKTSKQAVKSKSKKASVSAVTGTSKKGLQKKQTRGK